MATTVQLERSDLASPGAKFSQGQASLKKRKGTKEYRAELRTLARATVPATATRMERRKIDVLRLVATLELDHLRSGEAPDIFGGVIKFQMPDAE